MYTTKANGPNPEQKSGNPIDRLLLDERFGLPWKLSLSVERKCEGVRTTSRSSCRSTPKSRDSMKLELTSCVIRLVAGPVDVV